jgi:dUTP pyrophosphatase
VNVIKMKPVRGNAYWPTQGYEGDGCYDVMACEEVSIMPHRIESVPTGWAMEIPKGFLLDIRPRSGLSSRGVTLANSPGTLDEGYRGELMILLRNDSGRPHTVKVGDKVGQIRLQKLYPTHFAIADKLTETVRGKKGFGSTG